MLLKRSCLPSTLKLVDFNRLSTMTLVASFKLPGSRFRYITLVITSTSIGCPSVCRTRVFDSKWINELSTDSEIQLTHIYGAGEVADCKQDIASKCESHIPSVAHNSIHDSGGFKTISSSSVRGT